ncbi:hypothetical protein LmYK1_02300 [Ligilactobacillus murinus]|nr:hypothetical protein LmYK1_02300 [Ligilactobacillus murinus]
MNCGELVRKIRCSKKMTLQKVANAVCKIKLEK